MSTNETQLTKVKKKLLEDGWVSRNWALRQYISRLSALILKLRKAGYEIRGVYEDYDGGRDYVYHLIEKPKNE